VKIKVELKETSQALVHESVVNTYTKGDLYCVYDGSQVYKYPLRNIWRITEDYR
jgi:hypothetical protein